KEKHVPTADHLARIAPQRVTHPLGMRTVHDDETLDNVGTHHRGRPGYGAAPIVADYGCAAMAEGLDQIGHIADQLVERVVGDSDGCAGFAVTAHLGNDAIEAVGQRAHLMAP